MDQLHFSKLLFSLVLLCSLPVIMCRELKSNPKSKTSTLFERMKLEGRSNTNCWDSLFELQSCTAEIVLFFLNGETYLGPGCCNAIRTIQHQCWPSMLGSVGIDQEGSDVLLGYCDTSDGDDSGDSGSPPQVVAPIANTTTFHVVNP
ncbi:OLC1v1017581C1 [Oldenlandia corymbosa var. corymbosa]|uniref:OLC1v1017581C1 n=1 Tax=Oldenlandia corymbosa var. corymbosa TaxID=529605 RepID=A0AAV1E9S1_OLDCO|nr:OLC1v1017581C1 [Oldenlandia corymbosa var. corymbosa]